MSASSSAKRCSLDDREGEVAEFDIGLQQCVGADDDRQSAVGEPSQQCGPSAALFAPGREADLDLRRRRMALEDRMMLAGEDLGRRQQRRLGAALDGSQHCQQGDDGLAAADIALHEPHHALRPRHIGGDLGDDNAPCRGQRKAEPLFGRAGERPGAADRSALLPAAASPDEGHGELAREDLVIGEALARRVGRREIRLGGGRVDGVERRIRGGPAARFAQGRVDPFGERRDPVERRRRCPLRDVPPEARDHCIDRLDRLQPREFVGPQDQIGVRHLRRPVVELDSAADDPLAADRQHARQIVALDVEIDERQAPGAFGAEDPVRPLAVAGLVPLDPQPNRNDRFMLGVPQCGRRPPVDDAGRQAPDEVDDGRTRQPLEQFRRWRADARERRHRREQPVEDGGTHP